MANEKLPNTGMDEYHSKLVGKSHRKSDKGPTKEKIPLIDSKIPCITAPSIRCLCYIIRRLHYKFYINNCILPQ